MARSPFHDAVIVGAYNTRQAKVLDQPEGDVLWDAVNGALAPPVVSIVPSGVNRVKSHPGSVAASLP